MACQSVVCFLDEGNSRLSRCSPIHRHVNWKMNKWNCANEALIDSSRTREWVGYNAIQSRKKRILNYERVPIINLHFNWGQNHRTDHLHDFRWAPLWECDGRTSHKSTWNAIKLSTTTWKNSSKSWWAIFWHWTLSAARTESLLKLECVLLLLSKRHEESQSL